MGAIRLAESTPRRIYFDGSDWYLELESWKPVDRDVFAPMTTLVQGVEAIHSTLVDTPDSRELVQRLKPILHDRPKTRVSFSIVDGQLSAEPWPTLEPSQAKSESSHGSVPPTVQRSLVDLRNELELLRAQVHELELLISKFEPHTSFTSNENSLTHEEATFDAV